MPESGRVLGLDPGERWVGVALSDSDGRLALPLTTLDRREEPDNGAGRLRELLGPEGAERIVVGLPLDADGNEDAQVAAFRTFGEGLAAALGLPLEVQSERFSNPLAGGAKAGARRRRRPSQAELRKRKLQEHALAAATILQTWLDSRARRAAAAEQVDGARTDPS